MIIYKEQWFKQKFFVVFFFFLTPLKEVQSLAAQSWYEDFMKLSTTQTPSLSLCHPYSMTLIKSSETEKHYPIQQISILVGNMEEKGEEEEYPPALR